MGTDCGTLLSHVSLKLFVFVLISVFAIDLLCLFRPGPRQLTGRFVPGCYGGEACYRAIMKNYEESIKLSFIPTMLTKAFSTILHYLNWINRYSSGTISSSFVCSLIFMLLLSLLSIRQQVYPNNL